MIETNLNYLAGMEERPYYFLYPHPKPRESIEVRTLVFYAA